MGALEATAERQAVWSKTADQLKSTLDRTRWATLTLSVLGALFAAVASQLDDAPRWYLAMLSAALLAVATFLGSRLLGRSSFITWVRARAAGEALKREAYKFAAKAAPYDVEASREGNLNAERERIEKDVDDLLDKLAGMSETGSAPRQDVPPAEYLAQRVRRQIDDFYEPRAEKFRRTGALLGRTELVLSLLATLVTAVVGAAPKDMFFRDFDVVALTAVLTTIAGAVLAHIEASRYEFLVTAYRATARRLRNELAHIGSEVPASPSPEWSAFVDRCETIISEENDNWVAKWSKPS